MSTLPLFPRFEQLAQGYPLAPVYRRLLSDGLTPVGAFQKLDDGGEMALFESVIGGERVGRWSFLAVHPFLRLHATRDQVVVSDESGTRTFQAKNPLDELRKLLAGYRQADLPELPPFMGGAVGYASYDVIRYIEKLENAPPDDRGLPDLSFSLHDEMVVFDNVTKALYAVALARLDKIADPKAAYDDAAQRIDRLVARLSAAEPHLKPVDIPRDFDQLPATRSNFTQAGFEDAVRKCVEYIKAGDIFQVVISQRLQIDIESEPFEVYRTLRVVNPSPFMFFLRTPETTLVGSSPEVMSRVTNREVVVRPLAGTRPRGKTVEEDRRLAEELLADPKERAEHVMLVDLGRNDVGRVSEFGSVEVSDVMMIERYSHVMHITSHVSGRLKEGLDAFDAMASCLPAGTVSGAPKVRAMEIIDEVEPQRRGPYAGAVGYFDFLGDMDTCIALRTIVCQGKTASIQAGAGIVADSDPTAEWQETLNKARGLLKAIAITEQRTADAKTSSQKA